MQKSQHENTLALLIKRQLRQAGDYTTTFAPLSLHRRDAPTEPVPCIYGLGLAVTAQGGKRIMLEERVVDYGPGGSLLTTVDMPVVAHVTRAKPSVPYLGLFLKLDAGLVAQLALELGVPGAKEGVAAERISINPLDAAMLDCLSRLLELLDQPHLLPHLGPLIQREVIVRLLAGPHGPLLRHLSAATPPREQIARIVAWLKQHYTQSFSMEELSAKAFMSPSAFRKHFRAVTGMSPLQYQKQLRLLEARQRMLSEGMDAGSAAILVGYESVSQFSREYRRHFGTPPQRDVQRIRSTG